MSRYVLALSLLALVALASIAPGALASGAQDDLQAVEAKLTQCRKELAEARQAVRAADEFLALARRKRVVFLPGPFPGKYVPVRVDDYRDKLILDFVSGTITRAQLARSLGELTQLFAQTLRTLAELRDDARAELAEKQRRCAALARQRDGLKGGGGTQPAQGAFPGGTATTMTLTVGGASVTTDLKSNKQTGDPVVKAKSSAALGGSVKLNGTLPSGWTVVVFHNGVGDIRLTSPRGGDFTLRAIHASFDANTRPSAYVCSTKVPPVCTPAAQASITVDWDP
jgi:hypothetical protein